MLASIRKLKKSEDFTLYFDELVYPDEFPKIQPGYCTEECKEKMKEIYRITLEQDVIFGCIENFSVLHPPVSPQDEYARMAIKAIKVGIQDGKPVRLCELPSGGQCDLMQQTYLILKKMNRKKIE
ncbi:hypothetical protein DDB_G0288733 [Dictyostelium discoideum AX4]|uniref:Uncharacterized protein n=1 Tax=Dictyostelium discoideum TaxID=44689 RepID=Q54II2_DICDI|nr:hypothetical protein DDB_G0288733 [Dictyostelium discoideum AX4]EAL63098.1 hypothetical protein DDB_G0288733 [Dictyostelium discoideum AX4]|eukprot:XP_636604.1 hypothetical protein DDB_G0288733 [Dictyostelium discoideum AX4]